jgi:hypothetical protein
MRGTLDYDCIHHHLRLALHLLRLALASARGHSSREMPQPGLPGLGDRRPLDDGEETEMTKPPSDRLPDPIDIESGRIVLDDPDHPKKEVEEVNRRVFDDLRDPDNA